MGCWRPVAWLGIGVLPLLACTPALNWREARLPSGTYSGMLPCKQEPSVRDVELAGVRVRMSQLSCNTANSTFTLAEATPLAPTPGGPATNPSMDFQQALDHWRQAVLNNVGVSASAVSVSPTRSAAGSPTSGSTVAASPPILTASASRPGSQAPLQLTATWFSRGTRLYHAVYAQGLAPAQQTEVRELFFGNLKVSNP
jgi:hypothetical protein